ncbi:uncharacterized protein Dana_GF17745, isoform B [Drosophila ananassae]|uniref:Uncharacterized protein, isoform B n=1 Tax=Drosophila ananassae TaxID=7217 RepID=B3LZN6_DROAN|nr:uncharacterized protein LOC6500528 isoform X1 [Drosophila ananassae]XP_017109214.2 uncharacterized protein LOC108133692 [Drosophila bipectinata]KAH8330473.1 hypothetical protein KR067_003639 [Drosophila pandora]KAH8332662.1 hypothetical protein KR074_008715 [Drosophila pseudoananassae]EDV41978.2 uncharacterized protein Dana_GF17745, isoform C [Drosophila ananassae]KAH8257659.1 hypothetical protein KR026_010925 [Drosophila bipectinata]KPU79465.1 uncharacterized protein Dana_GF17745, isoform
MWNQRKVHACLLLSIVASNCLLMTFAFPQQEVYQRQHQVTQSPVFRDESSARKFAVKPNASKKVALDDIEDDLETNQIQESVGGPGGFTWSNMLSTVMTMFFNNAVNAPTKSDDVDNSIGLGGSPWANVISMGLRIINTLLGGGAPSDGIDKVDNGGSPMQGILVAVMSAVLGTRDPDQVNSMAKQAGEFIQIVMNLLDALKTSFSHRSLTARSLGKRDSVSDAVVASISLMKGYVRTYRNSEDRCTQKYMCDANTECVREIGGSSIFCQLGSYATSYVLGRTSGSSFEDLYDAGRRGRSGFDCRQMYLECNEV